MLFVQARPHGTIQGFGLCAARHRMAMMQRRATAAIATAIPIRVGFVVAIVVVVVECTTTRAF